MNIKPLRIDILGTRGIPANYGGFETFAEFLSIGLVKKGHHVNVYCPSYQLYTESKYKGVDLTFVPNFENKFKTRIPRALCNLVYDIHSLIKSSLSSSTHIYMLGYSAGPFLIIPKMFGKKLIINPDGFEWKSTRWGIAARSWLYMCEYLAAKTAHQLIGDAKPVTDRFKSKFRANISTIEYGTELYIDDGSTTEYPKDSYYVAVARMVPETKIDVIIEGFLAANLPDKILVVLGPIVDRHYFDTEISPRLKDARVKYLGAIYDKIRLKKLRANAAALIHGHASDGTNPSLLESMGTGSAVISIDRVSNERVLTRHNALYFKDSHTLAVCIRNFERYTEEQKSSIRLKNFNRVKENYSWDLSVEAHEKIFLSLN